MGLKIEILKRSHKKDNFDCGNEILNGYIKKQAKQDVQRDLSACYVLVETGSEEVIGYYTLSANSIGRDVFPADLVKKLPPSYIELPTILVGRLAISKKHQGNKLGEYILIDALNRCVEISNRLGILAVVVDPIDVNANKFYSKYGFILLPDSGKMFIPVKTIENSL
jgi:predicted GNAT family N-acyltransferase